MKINLGKKIKRNNNKYVRLKKMFLLAFGQSKMFNKPISAFPVSIRDLSFSLTDLSNSQKLQDTLLSYENDILKEKYIFDFYHNETKDELKIGFRFTFQSSTKTLEDFEIDLIMQDIINTAYKIESVSIPGLVR